MIDWLTLAFPAEDLDPETRSILAHKVGRVICVDAQGTVEWEAPKRETVRSDSHRVTIELGTDLRIYGSPARADSGENVFGSDDIVLCASKLVDCVQAAHKCRLPPVRSFRVSRVDYTENYHLGDLANVKAALGHLRYADGGRYLAENVGDSVYWNKRSTYRSGKAYDKGTHMKRQVSLGRAELTSEQLKLLAGTLRLELTLRRHFFSKQLKKPWHRLTPEDLRAEHDRFFMDLIGDIEVKDLSQLEQSCIDAAERLGISKGRGQAAYLSYCVISSTGFEQWKHRTPRSTYFTHKRILLEAGLSWADLACGKVVPFRRRRIELGEPVRNWSQLAAIA